MAGGKPGEDFIYLDFILSRHEVDGVDGMRKSDKL
jgi:hypothetical protein